MSMKQERPKASRGFGKGHGVGMPVEKAKDFKGTFIRLISYLKPYTFHLLGVFVAAILSTTFAIISPKILGDATTLLFEGMMDKRNGVPGAGIDFLAIKRILFFLVGLYIFSAFFSYFQQYIMAGVSQGTVFQLRKDVNEKLACLPLKYYDDRPHGETLSRVVNDVDNISSTLQQSLTQLITAIVTIVGVIVMMIVISPFMTLIVLLTLPLSFAVTIGIAKRSQKFFRGQQKALGELNGHVEEMYTGHTIVKAFGREKKAIETFTVKNEDLYESGWKAQFISGMIMPLMGFISNLGYVFVAVAGGILVTNETIKIGDVQAFIQYTRQFSQPITQVANIANIIQSTIASAERVFEILDEKEESDVVLPEKNERKITGEVVFENVTFGYQKDDPLIKNMHLKVEPGQTVAIVGPTGAGKTTLVNLLMRFYDIQAGKITIDGVDIREWNRGDLRSLFGMVLQDTWLFNGTIKENIAYGRADANEEEIIQAAKAAYADYFIRILPDGYETILNEEASNISQGQKQLLTIARAILAKPTILIFDEATSSVDTRTETHIQQGMEALMRGKTSFVIAHRLSTIRNADLILVMEHGSIVEQGNHEQLLAEEGIYAELYYSQFGSGISRDEVI